MTLRISLQDGFRDDGVVVLVNGDEVYRNDHVTESLLTGLSDETSVEVGEGPVRIDCEVPTQGLARSEVIDATATPYLGIAIVDGGIEFRPSPAPFFHG